MTQETRPDIPLTPENRLKWFFVGCCPGCCAFYLALPLGALVAGEVLRRKFFRTTHPGVINFNQTKTHPLLDSLLPNLKTKS